MDSWLLSTLVKMVDKSFKSVSFDIYVVFTLEIRTAKGLASAPQAVLPLSTASRSTVPVPQKGSNTMPSYGQNSSVFDRK